jgi:hypothetical protein
LSRSPISSTSSSRRPTFQSAFSEIAGEHLHLAGVQLLLGSSVSESQAGNRVGPFGQLGVLGDDAEFLLAGERPLAVGVPTVVELALVLVGPLLGHVVRGMATAGRVVHHPGLLGVLGAHGVQPLDGLVGDVVGEVVLLAVVVALGHADRRVVLA